MKSLLLVILFSIIILFFLFDLHSYLSLDYIKSQQDTIDNYYSENPFITGLIYFSLYIFITGVSLPGAAIMTIVGGAIFGLLWGTIIVSFASVIGASIAFLISRYILKDVVQNKFKKQLETINRGIEADGAFYLFTLRMVPVFPFFIINLAMGITTIKLTTFALVSQAGMLAGTIVYVNAGVQLSQLESTRDILSPDLLFAFALLGIFPLIAKKITDLIKAGNVYKKYTKPGKYDRNLVVIGAGSAGLVTAYIAAAVRANVTLIEKNKMGGDCLNTGCVPSKALIRSAKFIADSNRHKNFGIKKSDLQFEFSEIMDRVQNIIKKIEPHDSVERYEDLGVDCLEGKAKIISPWEIEVNNRTLTTKNIVIATGATPYIPPVEGIESIPYYTSDNVWELRTKPEHLVVLGGGPIGCELTQAFARLGCRVTQVESLSRLLVKEDPDISKIIQEKFIREKIDLRLEHHAKKIIAANNNKIMICDFNQQEVSIEFDTLLVAVGRKANTTDFGLETLGIPLTRQGTIQVNEYLQTSYPNIFACGDVVGPYQFTHTASHQAWYAAVNALFGNIKKFKVDYSVIPWATFTDPEIARVGLNEIEAKEKGIDYEVTNYALDDLDRAITDEEDFGMVKILTVPGKDRILGATIIGAHAGELITEYISAMKHNIGLNKVLGTIHIYPTLSEANKYAAGNWKKAHTPEKLLKWVDRYHRWLRN